jgi:hypothetical protein
MLLNAKCKLKRNNIIIVLNIIHVTVLLFQITEMNCDVNFDPRVGFTVTLHKITDSGDFVCKAIHGTTEQEVTYYITVHRKSTTHQEHKFCPQHGLVLLFCAAGSGLVEICIRPSGKI